MFASAYGAAARTALVVMTVVLAAIGLSCDGGILDFNEGVHPFELDTENYFSGSGDTGHYGPAWGRIEGQDVLVFRWGEGRGNYGGSVYTVRADGTGLELLSPTVGDFSWVGEGNEIAIAFDTSPATSPDGTRVAYVTLRYGGEGGGRFDIVTTTLDGEDLQLLTPGPRSGRVPAWSPDGTRIAFLKDGRLRTMAADGSDPRVIAWGIEVVFEPPAWSPDGTRLAVRGRDGALYIAGADGSNVTQVAEGVGNRPLWSARPAWSPDGRQIALVRDQGEGGDVLFVLDVDGGVPEALGGLVFGSPLWSPDGTEIFVGYTERRPDSEAFYTPGLHAIAVSGEHAVRRITEFSTNAIRGMAWSLDGARLAVLMKPFSIADDLVLDEYADIVLYTVAPDGSDLRVLVRVGADGELVAEQ